MGPIVQITYPKSGSHLLGYALGLGTTPTWHKSSSCNYEEFRTENEYNGIIRGFENPRGLWTHVPYSPSTWEVIEDRYHAYIFLRRDPRDIVVSIAHYVDKFPKTNLNYRRLGSVPLNQLAWHRRVPEIIKIVAKELPLFTPWYRGEVFFQAKYEDLIDDRLAVLQKIEKYLQRRKITLGNLDEAVGASHRRHPLSYRRAKYGDWKLEFNNEHVDLARELLTPVMEDLDYAW